jgi:hypothetical protein
MVSLLCNGNLTIGRSKEGLPLVGFKYQKADDWLDLNSKQEGVRLVGFKYQKVASPAMTSPEVVNRK